MNDTPYLICPICKSEKLCVGVIESQLSVAQSNIACNDCGFEWFEFYKFSHNETIDGVKFNEEKPLPDWIKEMYNARTK